MPPQQLNPQARALLENIRKFLPGCEGGAERAAELCRENIEASLGPLSGQGLSNFEAAAAVLIKEQERNEVRTSHSIFDRPEDWYSGPRPEDFHWPALRSYLIDEKGWDEDPTINSIDASSSEVVSLLGNPHRDEFDCRGLVVGYVQSGKTANMTAVIAKAVDAGYNLVIVLAGMTDKLRSQTQARLEKDIISRYEHHWEALTAATPDGDFAGRPSGRFSSPSEDTTYYAVVKKIARRPKSDGGEWGGPLGKLLDTARSTGEVARRRLKVLIIDDEADQASPNGAPDDMQIATINDCIRQLLKQLPCSSYVGYTATPFANVLIDPYAPDGALDDLYPRSFITALPKPDGYFGAADLFGVEPRDAGDEQPEEEGLNVIRDIAPEELDMLQPAKGEAPEEFTPGMPDSLEDAILYYIASCAARRSRGQVSAHMTMLVHTSYRVGLHNLVAGAIEGWVDMRRAALRDRRGDVFERMRALWEDEMSAVNRRPGWLGAVPFDTLSEHLPDVLDALEFPVENGESDDRINYDKGPKTYIVVGGTVLARGLTLEGLCVSYFLRKSKQYDTLLQMGRWFGYRGGYEDLARVWMPEELMLAFRSLARIEAEIREDMEEYRQRPVTPTEFAVRIRSIPGMAITARNKMRSAEVCNIGYWGEHPQTIRFPLGEGAEAVLKRNWKAGSALVSQCEMLKLRDTSVDRILYRDVPVSQILAFLREYAVHEDHRELQADFLHDFIDNQRDRLATWNVGVIEGRSGEPSQTALGSVGRVKTVRRTRLGDPERESKPPVMADIKALMSRRDVLFDCREAIDGNPVADDWISLKNARQAAIGAKPQLLLYPIDRNSAPDPKRPSTVRTRLGAPMDILGLGMVFPGTSGGREVYLHVKLAELSADELDAIEENEAEQRAQRQAAGYEDA